MECRVSKQNVVSCKGNRNNIPNVIYWDSPFNIDYQTFNIFRRNSNHREKIWQMLNSIPDENLILEETYKANIEKFDKAISSAIKGYFVNTKDGLRYQLPDGYQLSVRNVASGIKVFGTIRMLVDKGFLNHNDILLLDEPEVHLHPLWINVLAESLTILTRDMGIKVLLTTHNPQLAMGLESRTMELDGSVSYYHLSDDGNGNIIAEDITDNLDVMYKEMSDPIENAAAPFWE